MWHCTSCRLLLPNGGSEWPAPELGTTKYQDISARERPTEQLGTESKYGDYYETVPLAKA